MFHKVGASDEPGLPQSRYLLSGPGEDPIVSEHKRFVTEPSNLSNLPKISVDVCKMKIKDKSVTTKEKFYFLCVRIP